MVKLEQVLLSTSKIQIGIAQTLIFKLHSYLGEETAEIYEKVMAVTTLQNISLESEEKLKLFGPLTNLSTTIFCDSQAAIKALDTHILKSQLVKDRKVLLNTAGYCYTRPISICWMPMQAKQIMKLQTRKPKRYHGQGPCLHPKLLNSSKTNETSGRMP